MESFILHSEASRFFCSAGEGVAGFRLCDVNEVSDIQKTEGRELRLDVQSYSKRRSALTMGLHVDTCLVKSCIKK